MRSARIFLIALSLLFLGACAASSQPPATLTVFAASSLTGAFSETGSQFEAQHPGASVVFNFAGSQQLRAQLEQGAQADVYAAADEVQMDAAIQSGAVLTGTPLSFARNQLIVIVPRDNRAQVQTLSDLAQPGLKIIIAGPGVPVGQYTRRALEKMNQSFGPDYAAAVLNNVVSNEDNVKQVLAKVQLGEGDAGIVYTSDVTPAAAQQLGTLLIPDEFNVVATYWIAPASSAPQQALAREFIRFVLSDQGQSTLRKWGFNPP